MNKAGRKRKVGRNKYIICSDTSSVSRRIFCYEGEKERERLSDGWIMRERLIKIE